MRPSNPSKPDVQPVEYYNVNKKNKKIHLKTIYGDMKSGKLSEKALFYEFS